MNPDRVRERGIRFEHASGARLAGYALAFDKTSKHHQGVGHANLVFAPERWVEGVLYWLISPAEIEKMDPFERTPINYSREAIRVEVRTPELPRDTPVDDPVVADTVTSVSSWTYFANPSVRRPDLVPPRSYLNHLLAGRQFLSDEYYRMLESWPCEESR